MDQLWNYIYEIYKERSFTSAARNLFVSQPALSNAMKKLEGELGLRLFDRSTSPVRPTEAGLAYVRAIEEIRNIVRTLESELNDMSQLRNGTVTVSGANFISSFVIPRIIRVFLRRYPGIRIEMVESNLPSLQDQLLSEGTDLMLDYRFDEALFHSMPLTDEQILLCIPSGFPINDQLRDACLTQEEILAGRHLQENCPTVDLSILRDQPFIILKPGNDMCDRALSMCQRAGFAPEVVIRLDQLMTSFNMSRSGLGIAFVTDTLLRSVGRLHGVCCYRVADELAHRTLYIAYKKQRYLSCAVQAFIGVAQEVYAGGGNEMLTTDV